MPRDLGIANRLRAAGLKVVEVAGWQTRGLSTFDPKGSVDHHTAGPRTGNAPSLRICTEGRSDLPGPLCHVLIARDNTCYVIASGKANHAGPGGWAGLTGNSSVYGIERENVGTSAEPWRTDQTKTAAKAHAALLRGSTHGANAALVCRHQEWAPARKVDTHTLLGSELRKLVAAELKPAPPAPTPAQHKEYDDMHTPAMIVKGKSKPEWWLTDGITKQHITSQGHAGILRYLQIAKWDDAKNQPFIWADADVASIRTVA